MTDVDELAHLARVGERVGDAPGFIAHDLNRWEQLFGDPQEVLGDLPAHIRAPLAVCRTPRPGGAFAADIVQLSAYLNIDPTRLARFYRLLEATEALVGAAAAQSTSGLLAAARDDADEEFTAVELPPLGGASAAGVLPEWLARVTEQFWAGTEPRAFFPRDLELQILLAHPIAVLELADLRVSAVRPYLGAEASSELSNAADRRLHACLLAYGGIGIIFVDANDSRAERRINLAHEMGHFLVDYQSQRKRLAAYDPNLLDVMDGMRSVADTEALGALIADVPLGVQTHLLERDSAGGYRARSTVHAEDRAEQIAWELLAPRALILTQAADGHAGGFEALLEVNYGFPAGVAKTYGQFLARLASPRGDDWLDGLAR